MKTTENISLAGYAFTIETDAFEELEAYLDEIKAIFSSDTSVDEIAADIEERIAELLREKCVSGMVVDLSMVREIKKRIGNPHELAQEDAVFEVPEQDGDAGKNASGQKAPEKKAWKNRRLYRNMDERVIGGVCSGLGSYFSIDKVVFRILFLVFFFIGFAGLDDGLFVLISVMAYICLWIAMPAARTGEQKRQMKGKPLNLNNYRSKDFDFEREVKEVAESPAGRGFKRAGGIFLGALLLIAGLGGLLGCIMIPSLPVIIGNEFSEHILQWGPLDPGEQLGADLVASTMFWGLIMVMLGLFCIWFIYNGVMLLFDLRSPSWRPGLIIFIAWLVSLFVLVGWVLKTVTEALPMIV